MARVEHLPPRTYGKSSIHVFSCSSEKEYIYLVLISFNSTRNEMYRSAVSMLVDLGLFYTLPHHCMFATMLTLLTRNP